jgi:hypothetical protein
LATSKACIVRLEALEIDSPWDHSLEVVVVVVESDLWVAKTVLFVWKTSLFARRTRLGIGDAVKTAARGS